MSIRPRHHLVRWAGNTSALRADVARPHSDHQAGVSFEDFRDLVVDPVHILRTVHGEHALTGEHLPVVLPRLDVEELPVDLHPESEHQITRGGILVVVSAVAVGVDQGQGLDGREVHVPTRHLGRGLQVVVVDEELPHPELELLPLHRADHRNPVGVVGEALQHHRPDRRLRPREQTRGAVRIARIILLRIAGGHEEVVVLADIAIGVAVGVATGTTTSPTTGLGRPAVEDAHTLHVVVATVHAGLVVVVHAGIHPIHVGLVLEHVDQDIEIRRDEVQTRHGLHGSTRDQGLHVDAGLRGMPHRPRLPDGRLRHVALSHRGLSRRTRVVREHDELVRDGVGLVRALHREGVSDRRLHHEDVDRHGPRLGLGHHRLEHELAQRELARGDVRLGGHPRLGTDVRRHIVGLTHLRTVDVVGLPLVAAGREQERHEHHAQTNHPGTVHPLPLCWSNKVSSRTVHPPLRASFYGEDLPPPAVS